MALVEKTNNDWWRVLKQDGVEGYVPANYCRVIDGETVRIAQTIRKSRRGSQESKNAIIQRQETISADYCKLCNLAQVLFMIVFAVC